MRALRAWHYRDRPYYLVTVLEGGGAPRVVHEGLSSEAAVNALRAELAADRWAYLYVCHRIEGPVEDQAAADAAGATFPSPAVAIAGGRAAMDQATAAVTGREVEARALEHAIHRRAT